MHSRLRFTFAVIYVRPQSDVANNPSRGSGSRLGARAKSEQKELFCQLYLLELAETRGSLVRRRGDTAIDRSTRCRTFTP